MPRLLSPAWTQALCAICAAFAFGGTQAASAATVADPGTTVIATKTIGQWTGYAFGFSGTCDFSHCAIVFDRGSLGTVSVSMDSSRWSLGFSHPSWSLAVNAAAIPVLLSIDD